MLNLLLLLFGLAQTVVHAQINVVLPGIVTIPESTTINTVILNVSATTTASPPLLYSFVGPVAQYYLAFQPTSAVNGVPVTIVLANTISYLVIPLMKVTVKITDNSGNFYYAETYLRITAVPTVTPYWGALPYSAKIPENTTVGSQVMQISAWESYFNTSVSYFIRDPTGTFVSSNNLVLLNSSLNFPSRNTYYVPAFAQALVSGVPLTSSTTLVINVLDIPNRLPVFQQTAYYVTISENPVVSVIPSTLVTLLAIDPDYGAPSQILYTIVSSTWASYFSVGVYSGIVTQTQYISWSMCNGLVSINVTATKNSTQFPGLSATVSVFVRVMSANLRAPTFNSQSYNAIINTSAPLGTTVTLQPNGTYLSVSDADMGLDAAFSLKLVLPTDHSTQISTFTVFPSYAQSMAYVSIKLNTNLVGFTGGTMTFVILATETNTTQMLSASATITVNILAQFSYPLFQQSYYVFALPENATAGTLIGTVTASNSLSGSTDGMTYALNSYTNVFSVNSASGALTLANSSWIRYLVQNSYVLNYTASSNGITTAISVLINIINMDIDPPQFVSNAIYVNVSQSLTVGSAIAQVQAFDPDGMEQVVYSLSTSYGTYVINATTGVISLSALLHYATTPSYNLTVLATKPKNGLYATAQVYVSVQYAYFYAPIFTSPSSTSLNISGNLPSGASLFTVTAVDPNVPAAQSVISYSLLTAPATLTISSSTGVIVTTSALSYLTPTSFIIVVQATSTSVVSGSQHLSSYLEITVYVRSPPTFAQSAYFVIPFNSFSSVGTTVTQLQAVDNNLGGTPIAFSINTSASTPLMYATAFAVNPSTGLVTLQSSITNASGLVTLTVNAQNAFGLVATCMVYVSLIQFDMYAPQFVYPQQPNTTVYFYSLPVNSVAYTFSAQDSDSGNNGVVRYALLPSCTDNQYFSIDAVGGMLTPVQNLSAIKAQFYVCVQAYDLGLPTNMSSSTSLIVVLYNSVASPSFSQTLTTFDVVQGSNGPIGQLPAATVSGSSTGVCYYIIAGDPQMIFTLNATTRVLSLNQPLSAASNPFTYLLAFATTYCSSSFNHPGVNGNSAAASVLQLGTNNPSVIAINVYVVITTTLPPTTTAAYYAPYFTQTTFVIGVTSNMSAGAVVFNAATYVKTGSSGNFHIALVGQCNTSSSLNGLTNPINITSLGIMQINFSPSSSRSGTIECELHVIDTTGQAGAVYMAIAYIYLLNTSQTFIVTVSANQNQAVLIASPLATSLGTVLNFSVTTAQVMPNPAVPSSSDIYFFAVNPNSLQVADSSSMVNELAALQSNQQLSPLYMMYGVQAIQSAPTASATTAAPTSANSFTSTNPTTTTLAVALGSGSTIAIIVGVALGATTAIASIAAIVNHCKYSRLKSDAPRTLPNLSTQTSEGDNMVLEATRPVNGMNAAASNMRRPPLPPPLPPRQDAPMHTPDAQDYPRSSGNAVHPSNNKPLAAYPTNNAAYPNSSQHANGNQILPPYPSTNNYAANATSQNSTYTNLNQQAAYNAAYQHSPHPSDGRHATNHSANAPTIYQNVKNKRNGYSNGNINHMMGDESITPL